jgi:hypothetical protein
MAPREPSVDGEHLVGGHVEDRFEDDVETVVAEGGEQIGPGGVAQRHPRVEDGVEVLDPPATGGLGAIHGDVGVGDELGGLDR